MGCASSKQKRCKHCKAPYSPVPRSYSTHVVHPPQEIGDSYHFVALTSSTLGSLALDSNSNIKDNNLNCSLDDLFNNQMSKKNSFVDVPTDKELKKNEFAVGLNEAKTWSSMIEEKIPKMAPKTPTMTPPGDPETINIWELMAGLEDNCSPVHRFRSFSFDVSRDARPVPDSPKLSLHQNGTIPDHTEPMWLQSEDEEGDLKCPDFDPEVISTFRQSLQELSPSHPFYIKPQLDSTKGNDDEYMEDDVIKSKCTTINEFKSGKEKVIVYFTSLRGVRKTYEDCCHVRVILKGLGVRVDERDVSMHSKFKEEIRELVGEGFGGGALPRVFVGKKYIGGAEEIRKMHEEGQLEKVVAGCEMLDDSCVGTTACEACGDVRFVPCETCSGSCKIYYEEEGEEDDEEEDASGEFGFQRCPDCNENGLIRCPICCD